MSSNEFILKGVNMKNLKKYLGIVLAVAFVIAIMPAAKQTSAVISVFDPYEVEKIKDFLNHEEDGKSNGEIINPAYNADDVSTWTGIEWSDDADRHVTTINWSSLGLSGYLDVSYFSKLNYLGCSGNKLTAINVQNSSVYELDCSNNKLTSLSITGASNLNYLYCSNNNLPSLSLVFFL